MTLPKPGTTATDPFGTAKGAAGKEDSAQLSVDKLKDSIKELNAQLDIAAKFDLNPLADSAAKVQKAYDDALAKYSDTTNAFKNGLAVRYANLAADKERLTIAAQLADGYLKEARGLSLKNAQIALDTAGMLAGHAALDAYYTAAVHGSGDYAKAIADQSAATLKAKNDADDFALAQKSGANALTDISAALQANLGISKARADEIQKEAIATANLQHQTNALTQAQTDLTATSDQHTKNLQSIDDLNAQAAAYKKGADALSLYDLQKLKDAAIATLGSNASDPAQVAKAIADVEATANANALNSAAKLDYEMQQQLRLAGETTAQRQVDAQVQQTIADQTKAAG